MKDIVHITYQSNVAVCGYRSIEFMFVSPEHAKATEAQGSRLRPCKKCVARLKAWKKW